MDSKKRLNIGVFVCHIETEYVNNMCSGIIHAAEDMDANIIFFPGMYVSAYHNSTQLSDYDYQNNTVYNYARQSNIDILIISLGTIGPFIDDSDIESFLGKFKDTTLVILEEEVPGYPCLTIDNRTGFRECLEHLIHVHGFKRICYINGKHNNRDCSERLDVYLDVMKEHGLPVEPGMTPYGNLIAYCDPVVEKLLDQYPDTEALCFANDYMTLGGYRVLKSRGLKVGKDIAVTGFDDISIALMADPPLSTVKISTQELAYRAVVEGIRLYNGKEFRKEATPSVFIKRSSCGCTERQANIFGDMDPESEQCSSVAVNYIMFHQQSKLLYDSLYPYIAKLLELCRTYDAAHTDFSVFTEVIEQIFHSDAIRHVALDRLHVTLHDYIMLLIEHTEDASLKLSFSLLISDIYETVISKKSLAIHRIPESFKNERWLTSGIVRDALIYSSDTNAAIRQIMNKLHYLGIRASYLYLFDTPIIHNITDVWHIPKTVELIAYHNEADVHLLKDGECIIPIGHIFDHEFMEQDQRTIKTIFNLYINNEQYGLLVCELDLPLLYPAYSASLEISSTLKYLNMNRRLLNMSAMDELTRLHNRRGFFDKVNQAIQMHYGEQALLFFADLDSLKMINDTFGHEEGDYALMSAASILRKSFRKDDIVARLGGDEYICFALVNEESIIDQLKSRIRLHTDELNRDSDRPYYIEMSYGYTSFVCSNDIALEDMIKLADHSLYESKRFKRVNPFREQHKE